MVSCQVAGRAGLVSQGAINWQSSVTDTASRFARCTGRCSDCGWTFSGPALGGAVGSFLQLLFVVAQSGDRHTGPDRLGAIRLLCGPIGSRIGRDLLCD
jgi:hypothetical protein